MNYTAPETPEPRQFITAIPSAAREIATLLLEAGEPELAAKVSELKIVERCRCGDDFCASFYTQPKPAGGWGLDHRNVVLTPKKGMLILDIVAGQIAYVEVPGRDEIREAVSAAVP